MMPTVDLHAFFGRLWQQWLDLPRESQWLHGSAAFLLCAFVFLYWTPLGNRRAGVKCLALALLLHVLAYGFVRYYDLGSRPAAPPAVARVRLDLAAKVEPAAPALRPVDDPRRRADLSQLRQPRRETPAPLVERPKPADTPKPVLPEPSEPVAVQPAPAAKAPEPERRAVAKLSEPVPVAPKPKRAEPAQPTRKLSQAPVEIPLPAPATSSLSASELIAPLAAASPAEPVPESSALRLAATPDKVGDLAAGRRRGSAKAVVPARSLPNFDREPIALPSQQTGLTNDAPSHGNGGNGAGSASSMAGGLVGLAPAAPAPPPPAVNAGPAGTGAPGDGAMSGQLSARAAPNRLAIVEQFGGSPETEQAVADALAWLSAHQHPDGYWDSDGFSQLCPAGDVCSGPAIETGSDTGLTGLALLAFLGAGHTHLQSPKYTETVRRGLAWLLRRLAEDGDLRGPAGQGRIYCHAIATLALTEAYAMSRDERLKPWAQSAIDWLVRAQHGETGGWRYQPNQFGDTSVFGWVILALHSARGAGLAVPASTWTNAQRWLALASTGQHGGLAVYQPGHAPSPAMTAEALVCRQLFRVPRSDPALIEAADYLLRHPPRSRDYHLYYWYYGTLAAFQLGGQPWRMWNQHLTATLLETQRKSGHSHGSWDPQRPFGIDGGRVFTTAASALCLEVYYRYLPLYAGSESAERSTR